MKTKVLVHWIYLNGTQAIIKAHRPLDEIVSQLMAAGVSSPGVSREGDVLVSDVSVETILAALGFDGDGFIVTRQDDVVTVQEVLDAQ